MLREIKENINWFILSNIKSIIKPFHTVGLILRAPKSLQMMTATMKLKDTCSGRSQDGGGIGRRDHFLFYKFIERTTER